MLAPAGGLGIILVEHHGKIGLEVLLDPCLVLRGGGHDRGLGDQAVIADPVAVVEQAALLANLAHLRRVAEAEKTMIAPLLARASGAAVARVHQRASDVHDLVAIDELGREIVG